LSLATAHRAGSVRRDAGGSPRDLLGDVKLLKFKSRQPLVEVAAVAAVAVVVAAAVIISKRKNKPLQPTPQTQTSATREEPSPGIAVTMGTANAEDTEEGQV